MELTGLEPAMSSMRFRARFRLDFELFPGLLQPTAASSCDQLPPDYQAILGYLVTGFALWDQIHH